MESLFTAPIECSVLSSLNHDFLSAQWLKQIIWNEPETNRKRRIPLILDMNDPEMLMEYNEDSTQQIPLPSSSDIDILNLSNDSHYAAASRASVTRQKIGPITITHALPALNLSVFPTRYDAEALRRLHRPKLKNLICRTVKLLRAQVNLDHRSSDIPKKMRQLSGKEGKLILFEYTEQHPLIVMGIGMGSRLRNYYRCMEGDDASNVIEKNLSHFSEGEHVLLDPSDASPFLGNIEPGTSLQSLENKLFKVPIVKHANATTDFVLVRPNRDSNQWFIREPTAVFVAGQTQPQTEVPSPNSRAAAAFIQSRLRAYIFNLFRANQNMVKASDVLEAFPLFSENAIRTHLKKCAEFQRGGTDESAGRWVLNKGAVLPKEEELFELVPPEKVCAYESLLFGQQQLTDAGIKRFLTPSSLEGLSFPDKKLQEDAKLVEEELELTPWNLSSNFINCEDQLQLSGFGDPSLRGLTPRYTSNTNNFRQRI